MGSRMRTWDHFKRTRNSSTMTEEDKKYRQGRSKQQVERTYKCIEFMMGVVAIIVFFVIINFIFNL